MGNQDLQLAGVTSAAARRTDSASASRLPELDGLRGIAILMVFLLHYIGNSQNNNGQLGTPLYRFAQLFRLGWSGVDLFFVLSGFLIGGILLDARRSPSYFKTFYVRRIHRILPIYYVWITLFAIAGYAGTRWIAPADHSAFSISVPVAIYYLFLQNLVFSPLSAFSHYGMAVTWSLAVEEQFYLVSPWLIRYLSVRRLTQVLIGCVVGAPLLRAFLFSRVPNGHDVVYYLMPCRADALAMGMLAAVAWQTEAKAWLQEHTALLKSALAIFLCGALAMLKWLPGPSTSLESAYQYSWLAALYVCALVVALLDGESLLARVARWRFLREWGRVSYCIYLIHLAILGACHWVLLHSLPRINDWPGVFVSLLAAGLTWGIAQFSWKYFERPQIDRGHTTRYASAEPRDVPQRISEPSPRTN